MNVYGKDAVIGGFQLSNYELILASFDSGGESEEDLGMTHETKEQFIGHNPVPVYLGSTYSNKLKPTVTLIKNPCSAQTDYFTEHECREVLRQLTGWNTYKHMEIETDELDEYLCFNVKTNEVKYQKVSGKVVGIILEMECDSQFAWSMEYNYSYNVPADGKVTLYNTSDDLNNYLLPKISIVAKEAGDLIITNTEDNSWQTVINNVAEGETIDMDSKYDTISSSTGRVVADDFNMHFMRLVPNKNVFTTNLPISIKFTFRVPRKVGFL